MKSIKRQFGKVLKSKFSKPVLHFLCLLPFSLLILRLVQNELGANPVETLTHGTGEWGLRFLILTLAMSPLRQWTGLAAWLRFRRILGLYVFFYVACHFSIWLLFDHSLDLLAMLEDIYERPYITIGFSAFVLLIPLAITSNQASISRLGKRWRLLHRLVYPIGLLAVLHFLWLVKADYLEPGIYAGIMLLLLLHRKGPLQRLSNRVFLAVKQ